MFPYWLIGKASAIFSGSPYTGALVCRQWLRRSSLRDRLVSATAVLHRLNRYFPGDFACHLHGRIVPGKYRTASNPSSASISSPARICRPGDRHRVLRDPGAGWDSIGQPNLRCRGRPWPFGDSAASNRLLLVSRPGHAADGRFVAGHSAMARIHPQRGLLARFALWSEHRRSCIRLFARRVLSAPRLRHENRYFRRGRTECRRGRNQLWIGGADSRARRLRRRSGPGEERPLRRPWPIYLTIALSGACALGAEAIWTRLLGLIMGATVYTFAIILAVFLAGLGIGSDAGSMLSRIVRPQKALGYCQLVLTVAVAWTAFMLAGSLPYWPISSTPSNPWFAFQLDLARTIWAIAPATILWGASFPLALSAAAVADADPARLAGGIYAANTGGAIAGALAFSVFLVPAIGTRGSERLFIVLSAVSALCALVPLAHSSRLKSWRAGKEALWLSASAIVAALLALSVPAVPAGVIAYGRSFLTLSPSSRILYVGEGLNSSIAISEWERYAAVPCQRQSRGFHRHV